MRESDARFRRSAGPGLALLLNLLASAALARAQSGVDLTASFDDALQGPAGSCAMAREVAPGPGTSIPVTFRNLGPSDATPATYRLWITRTNTLPFDSSGGTQTNIAFPPDGTVDLAGFDAQERCLAATVPSVAEGDYYLALQMDPEGAFPNDLNPANNVVFSAFMVHVAGAGLRVGDLVSPKECFQGRPTDIGFSLTNDGLVDAEGFSVGLFLVPQGGALTTTAYKVAQVDQVSLKAGCAIVVRQGSVAFSNSDGCYVWPAAGAVEVVPGNDRDPRNLPAGIYNAGVIADVTNLVLARLDRGTNHLASSTNTVCNLPLPDFSIAAAEIEAPPRVSAGDKVLVQRTIRNLGVSASATTYAYFLNLNSDPGDLEVHRGGIPIPVVLPSGELTFAPTVTLDDPGGGESQNRATDLLVIPSALAPPPGATYTLALALDPTDQVRELDKSNNLAGVGPIEITKADLAIGTVNLPAALARVPYSFSFQASGGFGEYVWTMLAGSPPHMSLSSDGVLRGTPAELGTWQFLIQVASAEEAQVASVTFSVVPPSGPLQVVKSGLELPPAAVGEIYAAQLAAQGGTPPYRWVASPQSIPDGLGLSASGLLSGAPTARARTEKLPAAVAVTVTDQAGNSKSDTYLLQVGDSAELVITTGDLPALHVNQPWVLDLFASGCEGTDPGVPWCHFTLPPGQLVPPGLELITLGKGETAFGRLSGLVPEPGIWVFDVQVTDDAAHLARAHLRLRVDGGPLALPEQTLPTATAGETYAAQLTGLSGVNITWLLYSGDLPPGLSLSADGSILGTVPPNAGIRTYAFVASARDEQGSQSLQAEAITVLDASGSRTGCSTGRGAPTSLGLLGFVVLSRRWRRGGGLRPQACP